MISAGRKAVSRSKCHILKISAQVHIPQPRIAGKSENYGHIVVLLENSGFERWRPAESNRTAGYDQNNADFWYGR